MVDMAHIAGLVAAGVHPTPVGIADIVTTTIHKTLGGPRAGMVHVHRGAGARRSTRPSSPGLQGGPLMHVIAGKAVALGHALTPEFRARQRGDRGQLPGPGRGAGRRRREPGVAAAPTTTSSWWTSRPRRSPARTARTGWTRPASRSTRTACRSTSARRRSPPGLRIGTAGPHHPRPARGRRCARSAGSSRPPSTRPPSDADLDALRAALARHRRALPAVPAPAGGHGRLTVLSTRALNRALLARQLLLARASAAGARGGRAPGGDAGPGAGPSLHRAVEPRRRASRPRELADLVRDRAAVRVDAHARHPAPGDAPTTASRCARRCRRRSRGASGPTARTARALEGDRRDALLATGAGARGGAAAHPRTAARRPRRRLPGRDPHALGQAVAQIVPMVQVPPRGVWGESGRPTLTTVEAWLGAPVSPTRRRSRPSRCATWPPSAPPARADLQAWSGTDRRRVRRSPA